MFFHIAIDLGWVHTLLLGLGRFSNGAGILHSTPPSADRDAKMRPTCVRNTISASPWIKGKPFDLFTPLIPCLASTVQNVDHITPD
jgi:hypothetical protein